jgi:BMFP domain-containing protein YqiC
MFILIGVSLIAGSFLYGKSIGKNLKENEVLKIQQEAASKAREQERKIQSKINQALKEQINEKDIISRNLADDIKRLQHRESRRLSEAARINCQGASGLELAKEHAEFLSRYAAQAAEQDAALKACYSYADSLQD